MPSTDAEIANLALGLLGTRATVTDLTENSVEAREINRVYSTVRDTLMGGIDWNFARVYRDLAASGTPPTKWTYSYEYPSDCLKFIGLDMGVTLPYPQGISTIFEIGRERDAMENRVWCDMSPATGVYVMRVTAVSQWHADFVSALSMALAAAVALPLTQNVALANSLKAQAKAIIEDAEVGSANERMGTEAERVAESLTVRGYDGYDGAWSPWGPFRINW